jgi:hypothetical protein
VNEPIIIANGKFLKVGEMSDVRRKGPRFDDFVDNIGTNRAERRRRQSLERKRMS